jgi:hypothetical protein
VAIKVGDARYVSPLEIIIQKTSISMSLILVRENKKIIFFLLAVFVAERWRYDMRNQGISAHSCVLCLFVCVCVDTKGINSIFVRFAQIFFVFLARSLALPKVINTADLCTHVSSAGERKKVRIEIGNVLIRFRLICDVLDGSSSSSSGSREYCFLYRITLTVSPHPESSVRME